MPKKPKTPKQITSLKHKEARRTNIPTAEYQSVMEKEARAPVKVAYPRRYTELLYQTAALHDAGKAADAFRQQLDRSLDPQLLWRGKDQQDWSDLVVNAPPLYIQEKVTPKIIIDDLRRVASEQWRVGSNGVSNHSSLSTNHSNSPAQPDLFGDFNGLPEGADKTDFYHYQGNWQNRMILGDSLQVMASLAEREGLRGKVQCIYLDPPYGIKFNSNFQWSTTSRDVKDGKADHITREPEQVEAFRDTWRDGIHSYLTYLRDRLTVARDLLTESGSIFVQIGDENVHRVRAVMDEVFGDENYQNTIYFTTTGGFSTNGLSRIGDYVLWYAKNNASLKHRRLLVPKKGADEEGSAYKNIELDVGVRRRLTTDEFGGSIEELPDGRIFRVSDLCGQGASKEPTPFDFQSRQYTPTKSSHWKPNYPDGLRRTARADRIYGTTNTLNYVRFFDDYPVSPLKDVWSDTGHSGFAYDKLYVVQTATAVIQRCILMSTDPGDLVLDPTCGSGTTAYVAEQWGRRWITIDTSRVALALARGGIMGARYPYYLLADSREGQKKEWLVNSGQWSAKPPEPLKPTYRNIALGFVYERVPHITLKSIANNAEIDVIWEKFEKELAPLRKKLSSVVGDQWLVNYRKDKRYTAPVPDEIQEWEVPRERPADWPPATQPLITDFWKLRIQRQKEIDASIAAKANFEYLYDKPYIDRHKVRVAGPFTVESLSPHRVLGVDENDELIDGSSEEDAGYGEERSFVQMILENLKTAGVQQAHKDGRITFTSLTPWPGDLICAEGRFSSDQWSVVGGQKNSKRSELNQLTTTHPPLTTEIRAGIFIGPEFGTVSRPDLVEAAREAADAGFDVLIACAFNYDAHATEFEKLGRIPILKARMNADLHMADDLKNTGKGNLFVIFGEPDITVAGGQWLVTRKGRLIANYEQIKKLSGLGSLEEINRSGREGLSGIRKASASRKVRTDQPDSTSIGLGAGQHRGRSGTQRNSGVSAISRDSERLAGGNRDISDSRATSADAFDRPGEGPVGIGGHRWTDDQWSQTLTALKSLTDADFPLALTTDHKTQVTVHGVDVFKPQTGEVVSDGPDGIACWFIDTNYNEESFFVRQAYFLGANDPYKSLKTTLKAEINKEAWETLYSDTSRPFDTPETGRIAVKVINHLGDEVMKVFRI